MNPTRKEREDASAARSKSSATDPGVAVGWTRKRFGDFATLQRGYDLPAHDRKPGDVPVLGSNGIVGYHDKAMAPGPGVVTGRSGTMGLSHYADRDFWPLNTALFVTDFHGNLPRFTQYFFQFFDFAPFVAGVSVPTLNRNLVHEATLVVPPVREQQAIARVLSKVQAAVEAQEKIVAGLRELKAATMAKLFREGLRGERRRQTEIGEIPRSWEVVPLGSLALEPDGFIQTGPFGSQLHASDYKDEGIPIVNPTHIDDGRIKHGAIPRVSEVEAERLARHLLRPGDILFSRRGDVARHAWVGTEEADWLCGTGCLLVRPSAKLADSAYVSWFLETAKAREYLEGHAVGSIMPNINTRILAAVPIAVPSRDDQVRIRGALDALQRRLSKAKKQNQVLRSLFSSTLHLLMTGQVRVPLGKDA